MTGAEQHKLREYLLGQLPQAEEEQVELRLLSDPDFVEEYDIIVDEITDDYVAGKFAAEEREQVEQYFFKSPKRRNKLKFALALKARKSNVVAGKGGQRAYFIRYLAIAASLLLVVGGGIYVWRVSSYDAQLNEGLAALQSAFRDERPLESRISRLDYAPFLNQRGGPGTEKIDQNELSRAELTVLNALKDKPTPAARHALGKVFLAKKDFDRAIKEFDEALKGEVKNAQLYSDLGVAWLEKGKIDRDGKEPGKGLEELGRSLEYLNKALELDPDLLEALFNRALSRQYQKLYSQAEADWRDYLKKDSSSQWAAEATRNLKLIEGKKAASSSKQDRPLDRFLGAYRAGNDQAAWQEFRRGYTSSGNVIAKALVDTFLRESADGKKSDSLLALDYVGQLQLRNAGDNYDADLARVYSSATPAERIVLSQAREQVSTGYELFRQSRITDSMDLLSSAREKFSSIGDSGEALFAEYSIAHGATVQPDLEKSGQIFARIIPLCEAKGYKWLLAQCLTERAHLHSNLNNFSEAIDDSNRALSLSEDLQDENGMISGFIQLASLYLSLNDSRKSLAFIQRGITKAEEAGAAPMLLWGMYIAAAINFDNLHAERAALDYQKEALSLALDSHIPLYISRSYQYLGHSYGELGLFDEALRNVGLAYDQGHAIAGDRNGQNMMANASLSLGDLYRASGDLPRAHEAYDESVRLYEALGFSLYSYAAHKGKLLLYLSEHNDEMASRELGVVLNLFEGYREKILEERQRNFFFDKEQDVYDLAIDFAQSRTNDPRRSFEYSETSRSRSLLDLLSHGGLVVERKGDTEVRMPPQVAKSLPLDKIKELMPDGVQLLQYAVLKDKVIIWVITKSDFTAKTTEIESKALADEVARSLKLISSGDEAETAKALKSLYEVLIKPVESSLSQAKLLCIVPDKDLNYVPFAALMSASGRYLVQDYRLMLSPSASVFIHCSEEAKAKSTISTERLLAVGNPSFDRQAYPEYDDLEAAEREAAGVGLLYPSRRVLLKAQATAEAVKAELPRADVAHFAAHYVIDNQSALSSKLLLAKSAGDDPRHTDSGQLEARDVCRMKLSHTRLVVLSACQSGIERQYGGEGPTSFARQFIVAGVPVVVASLWPVDSEPTAELMIAFQRLRKTDKMPTAQALRLAQEEMLASSDARYRRPYYWAAFVTIGGYAEF